MSNTGAAPLSLDGIIASRAYQDEVMRPQRELEFLCEQPSPHLVINLGKPVEAFMESGPPKRWLGAWGWAGLEQILRFGPENLDVVHSTGNWTLFRLQCPGDPRR